MTPTGRGYRGVQPGIPLQRDTRTPKVNTCYEYILFIVVSTYSMLKMAALYDPEWILGHRLLKLLISDRSPLPLFSAISTA